jgi:cysteine desulfurase
MNKLAALTTKTYNLFNRTSFILSFSTQKVQYFDYQATTPIDYRVLDAMMPYLTQYYGNPHSKTHQYGWDSATAIETARAEVADLIKCDPK